MKKALSLILALVFAFALCGCSLNTDFIVTGSLIDGESEEDMLSGMHAVVSFNAESEPYVLRARLYMEGMDDPIEATLTASSQGLGVYFPMFLDNYYLIDWNAFKEIASETSPVDINTFSSENFNTDDLVDVQRPQPVRCRRCRASGCRHTATTYRLQAVWLRCSVMLLRR